MFVWPQFWEMKWKFDTDRTVSVDPYWCFVRVVNCPTLRRKFCWEALRFSACCAPGSSWHFFVCAPNCWFTLPLMTCEVRCRLCNGLRNVARSVQMVHCSSLLLLPSPSLSVSSSLLQRADIFSASFIYAPFHQRGVVLAKCQVKLSLKIRDEFISLSLNFVPFLCCLRISAIPSQDGLCSPCMQRLTNGLGISWLERMESRLAESESMAWLKLTLSRITLYAIFPLHLERIMNFWNGTQCVLFMIREAKQYKMNVFCMKCIPISNTIM